MTGSVARVARGTGRAVARRPGTFLAAFAAIVGLSLLLPPLVLSVARKPVDYFTVNPWLARLPEYLASPEVPAAVKLEKLSRLALFWFSADSPMGGTEWGFAVDVTDLGRILLTALLFGAYAALWAEHRRRAPAAGPGWAGRPAGALGAVVGVLGLSTGPCSVMGCGAPVLPVVGLAFAGLSSTTLALLAGVSRLATPVVLAGLVLGVGYLGWRAGRRDRIIEG